MGQRSDEAAGTRRADIAQRESDHDRWADDGGFSPEPDAALPKPVIPTALKKPFAAVGLALAVGLAIGWFVRRR
jgi:hypothetical protein